MQTYFGVISELVQTLEFILFGPLLSLSKDFLKTTQQHFDSRQKVCKNVMLKLITDYKQTAQGTHTQLACRRPTWGSSSASSCPVCEANNNLITSPQSCINFSLPTINVCRNRLIYIVFTHMSSYWTIVALSTAAQLLFSHMATEYAIWRWPCFIDKLAYCRWLKGDLRMITSQWVFESTGSFITIRIKHTGTYTGLKFCSLTALS